MSISTKTGDNGTTALLYNRRVYKSHPRIEATGRLDELSSALGLCRAHSDSEYLDAFLLVIQEQLVHLMGEISTDNMDQSKYKEKYEEHLISGDMVDHFTELVKEKESGMNFSGWKQPGKTISGAFFDSARTACRRSERGIVALKEDGAIIRPVLIEYLNRLSDLLWLFSSEQSN
jgi:cob(I)alamin adenosyltransferase